MSGKSPSSRAPEEVTETYDLPTTVQDIVSAITDILMLGGVQELVLKKGHPIRVRRYNIPQVRTGRESTPWKQVREVRDFMEMPPGTAQEVIYSMLTEVDRRNLVPVYFLVGSEPEMVRRWLGVPLHDTIFGVKLLRDSDLPGDAIMLLGAPFHGAKPYQVLFVAKGTVTTGKYDAEALRDGVGGWFDPSGSGEASGEAGSAGGGGQGAGDGGGDHGVP